MIRSCKPLGLLPGLLLLLTACASKEVEERMANPQLRDLFPPVEAPPPLAAAGQPEVAGAPGAAASASGDAVSFSPATLDAPDSDASVPGASTPAAAAAPSAAAPAPGASTPVAAAAPSAAAPASGAGRPVAVAAPSAEAPPLPPLASPAGAPWPRAITAGGVAFEVFEPALQQWDGELLVADAVVSALPAGAPQPSAGVIRLAARTQVDRAAGLVALDDIRVTDARFQANPEQQKAWLELLRAAAPRQVTRVSLQRLQRGADLVRARESGSAKVVPGNPRIVLARNPVAVVNIDGEPRLVPITGTALQGVINTRALLLKAPDGRYYLRVYDGWMSAPVLRGPWTVAKAPKGADVATGMATEGGRADLLQGTPNPKTGKLPSLSKQIPNVVVTTQLTVVIGVNGAAKWAPIPGTQLQYVTNTKANVFRDAAAKRLYILARGRWFVGTATGAATAEFVPATKLPADFGRIPSGHPKAGVRAYLEEAPESALEAIAETPSVKAVSRKEAKFNVTYDGDPRLKPIEGTGLSYVVNASAPVIRLSPQRFYGVQNAVWFTAERLIGPWTLADEVPPEIYAIPPSSPIYHAVNSRVYASSTDKVYYGYNADPASYRGGNLGAEGVAAADASTADVYYGYGPAWGPAWGPGFGGGPGVGWGWHYR
jgi:hypothetical protein